MWCWGDNNLGLVGDGTTGNTRSQPTEVNGIIDATAVELGNNAAYARDHVQARSAARA